MLVLQPEPVLPNLEVFEEGDVVVTFEGSIESWLFFLGGRPDNIESIHPFSHTEMVFRSLEGELMLGGVFDGMVNSALLRERIKKFRRIAVFRAKAGPEKRQKAARVLSGWLAKDSQVAKAKFDYSMNYQPGRTDEFFCAGIINEACRIAALELPFKSVALVPNELTRQIEVLLGVKFDKILGIDTIFSSNYYNHILSWENDQIDKDRIEFSKQIALYLMAQYEQGWRLKLSDGVHLFANMDTMPKIGRAQMSLRSFQKAVFKTWNRLSRRGELEKLDTIGKTELLATICDKYREEYFDLADAAAVGNDHQQLHTAVLAIP
ncbi:hypothetical protein [Desulfocapsa sulfexigens]|nr:hypothetical protein [Desulfocapsa sulfexigens]